MSHIAKERNCIRRLDNGASYCSSVGRNTLSKSALCLALLPVMAYAESVHVPEVDNPTSKASMGVPTLKSLAAMGASVGTIHIVNDDIFDLNDPGENGRLYRLANTLHRETRPNVIASQLLFEPGEKLSLQSLEESERLLRSNRYLLNAEITPTEVQDGVVSLEVRTTDVWSMNPSMSFGRSGGANSGGFGIKEYNLLGTGSRVEARFESNVDRDITSISFGNRHLFGTRTTLRTDFAQNSDGYLRRIEIGKPFYALDSRRSWSAGYETGVEDNSWYDRGEISAGFQREFSRLSASKGWSRGLNNGWARRYRVGVAYDNVDFGPADNRLPITLELPKNREFLYPFASVEWVEDEFDEVENVDQIGRIEDRHLGTRLFLQLGFSPATAVRPEAMLVDGHYRNTLFHSAGKNLTFDAAVSGRYVDARASNLQLRFGARYDHRLSERQMFHARIATMASSNLDLDNTPYLGGDSGLRGYPLRYQGGSSSALITIEQRFFTDWYPWKLFRIGGAVFFDAGRTWGQAPQFGENLGWLKDVGVGLRVGNTRSGVGRMLHIDFAYPLDGESGLANLQLLIEAKRGF